MRRWVDQIKAENQGITPSAKALTQEQQRIQELENAFYRELAKPINETRVSLCERIERIFKESKGSAGSRSMVASLRNEKISIDHCIYTLECEEPHYSLALAFYPNDKH